MQCFVQKSDCYMIRAFVFTLWVMTMIACGNTPSEFSLSEMIYEPGIHTNKGLWKTDSLLFYNQKSEALSIIETIDTNSLSTEQKLYYFSLKLQTEPSDTIAYNNLNNLLTSRNIENPPWYALFGLAWHHYDSNLQKEKLISLLYQLGHENKACYHAAKICLLKSLYYKNINFDLDSTWNYLKQTEYILGNTPGYTPAHLLCFENMAYLSTYKRKVLTSVRYSNEMCNFDRYLFVPDSNAIAIAYNTRSFLIWRAGDTAGAHEDAELALKFAHPINDPLQYQEALKNKLVLALSFEDWNTWNEYWQKLSSHYEQIGQDFVNMPRWLGIYYFMHQNYDKALDQFDLAMRYLEQQKYANRPLYSTLLYYMADCHVENHEYSKALDCMYLNQNQEGTYSKDRFKKILMSKDYYTFVSGIKVAEIYLKKYNYEKKIADLKNSFEFLQLIDTLMYRQLEVHEENAVLTFYLETGEFYFQLGMKVNEELWQVTQDAQYLEKFLEYNEKSKNRLMYRDMMSAAEVQSASTQTRIRERELKIQIKQEQLKGIRGNNNFNLAVKAYDLLEENMKAKESDFLGESLLKGLVKCDDLIKLAKKHKLCLISVEEIDDFIYFLLINDKGIYLDKTHFSNQLQSDIEQRLNILRSSGDTSGIHSLSQRIIPERILQQLSQEVFVVPDGMFFRFPFAVLLSSEYEVFYTPSLQLLLEKHPKKDTKHKKLAIFSFTDPETIKLKKRTRLREIPGAYKEVLRFKKLYPDASIFTGRNATKENFIRVYQDPSYHYIHLALHGLANSAEKDNVKLFFRTRDFGIDSLYGYELLNYHSSIQSVTLSACQTGLGALVMGEGSYSLPRYFIINGASSVKASLWDLEDEEKHFFVNYSLPNYKE